MSPVRMSVWVVAVVAALVAGAVWVVPSMAQEPPPPIAVELLSGRGQFTDDVDMQIKVKLDGGPTQVINLKDPSRIVSARITVQPGAQFPWHTHPGPVFVNVVEGELVYVAANDCVPRPYQPGEAFVDPGRGNVHTAFNPTEGVTVFLATFFEVPGTGPLTITEGVQAPDNCQIEVGAHGSH
jgi:quercetin dioxygenase-like cupin family protein